MDSNAAQSAVDEARNAYVDASRPRLGRAPATAAGVLAGAGVAAQAQGDAGPVHLVSAIGGVVLLAGAYLLPELARRRRGLHGHRGWTRTENTTLLVCIAVIVICGFGANRDLASIYVGLGTVSAMAWYATVRGTLVAGGRGHR